MKNARRIATAVLAAVLALPAAAGTAVAPARTEGITIPAFTTMKRFNIPDTQALDTVRDMKVGWNLGNAFDAFNGYSLFLEGTGLETYWCRAVTTRELLGAVKEAGFNAVRIPVSWHNHTDRQGRIDPVWMGRVREVADWALEMDLYVIVNVHHDNDPACFYPDSAHFEASAAWLGRIWKQMAEAFRDAGDRLILESMNEPRLTGTRYEWYWDPEVPECLDAADCINRLNQLFVDTVRGTGGNNATRYLAVPAYDASPWYACSDAFILPEDPAENRLILSAHAYTPYSFTFDEDHRDNAFDPDRDTEKKREIFVTMDALYERFVSRGIPVLIDEFGAQEKSGNLQARVNYAAYYAAAASTHGITCFWWDNNVFTGNGERFGLIDRKTVRWIYPDIALALKENCLTGR